MGMMERKNRYRGVNAHLMSRLQHEGGFQSFHSLFIAKLTFALNKVLPEQYWAKSEDTLSILQTFGNGKPIHRTVVPDVSLREAAAVQSSTGAAVDIVPSLYVDAPQPQDIRRPLSTVIYHTLEGKPVSVIELLSPSNKRGDRERSEYREKRYLLTRSGLALTEIDLLHEMPSIIDDLPPYPLDPSAHPYYIAISPAYGSSKTAVFWVGLNQPVPTLPIPLGENETVLCDFDQVYQETFEEGRFGYEVDYTQEPPHMQSYSPADQAQIHTVMEGK